MAFVKMEQLTDEQVENWRKVLYYQFGAYAMIMPKEDVQTYHDKMQASLSARATEKGGGRRYEAKDTFPKVGDKVTVKKHRCGVDVIGPFEAIVEYVDGDVEVTDPSGNEWNVNSRYVLPIAPTL